MIRRRGLPALLLLLLPPLLTAAPAAQAAAPAATRAPPIGASSTAASGAVAKPDIFTVSERRVPDEKAVFATVESRNVVPARTRIGGTVTALSVQDGDDVAAGQQIASVHDEKLQLQITALDAQIAGLRSSLAQADIDLARANALAHSGAVSREQLDHARTAVQVATSALNARIAQRAVAVQQQAEGAVLAPIAGRVLTVPVTDGTVVLAGDPVATVAEQHFVLRLLIPERHALHLKAGDTVRLDGKELGETGAAFGRITLVYPQITAGQVRADATAPGIGTYFVGERIRVWVPAGERRTIVVPSGFVFTRFGQDYARLRRPDGRVADVPVQRGLPLPTPAMPDGLQILAGLTAGDVLVRP
ncbi:MAG: efflux RND transporter periplasmic adaptor subunit [Rhodospirillales bacterium]|jgi:RND family efflux transporter MFP subunit|nr:efflux RND transporter periplasmic adaptor subunit [Rhodospirillales bacterium]